jgi:ApaG protein
METAITDGIKISVETFYESESSKPKDQFFFFSYMVTIENQSNQVIQLLKRKWNIFDSIGKHYVVEGDGVIGKQPILTPGEIYTYESSCYISSDMGKMWGHYVMERQDDGSMIEVTIPEFQLMIPFKMN